MKGNIDLTIAEVLQKWDNDEPVMTCSLGGLGEDYEQVIQVIGFELLRATQVDQFDYNAAECMEEEASWQAWETYRKRIEKSEKVKRIFQQLMPSGAQVSAAWNFATVINRHGYREAMKMVPKNRLIEVCRSRALLC